MPLAEDLSAALDREVRVANDANCLAVSEVTDGAAAGARVVFGVILGTGAGGGVAIDGKIHAGPNGVAGEWGHNPLPWGTADELPGRLATAQKRLHGDVGLRHRRRPRLPSSTGKTLTTRQIVANAATGDVDALAALDRFEDRLARGLAVIINILDPDVFVFGGGLSLLQRIYTNLPAKLPHYVFGGEAETPLVQAKYGDSSGVRGAAWLWPAR